ncbi:MAG: hypothetical protein PHQ26_10020 [Bacteroidales bacterium]|nr:hypothetical protein [Bacteroidales bacterium]
MSTVDFDAQFELFYAALEVELMKLLKKHFRTYRTAAEKDVKEYLRVSRGRLEDYARLVALKQLTPEEQAFLQAGLKENAVLYQLKESGRRRKALEKFAWAMVEVSGLLVLKFV